MAHSVRNSGICVTYGKSPYCHIPKIEHIWDTNRVTTPLTISKVVLDIEISRLYGAGYRVPPLTISKVVLVRYH